MINIYIRKSIEGIKEIKVSGHANYAEVGKDIICSGVSAIVFGTLNAIDEVDKFDINKDEKTATISIDVNSRIQYHDKIVLETMIIQLQTIQNNYPQYIKIKFDERK